MAKSCDVSKRLFMIVLIAFIMFLMDKDLLIALVRVFSGSG